MNPPSPTRSARDRLTELAVGAAYGAGWAAVRLVPARPAAAGFRFGADLAWRQDGAGVQRLRGNLARVVPDAGPAELAELTRRALRSYARYWRETFQLPVMDKPAMAERGRVTGAHIYADAFASGRGVIIALPHTGNWDIAGVWMQHHHYPLATVAERLRPESVFRRFVAHRESLGMEVLALGPDDPSPVERLSARLRAGGIVCLVADRDLTGSGVPVDFFGAPARMPAGPAFLAATTGAVLIPLRLHYEGEYGWGMHFHDPLPVGAEGRLRDRVVRTTQALADVFAADIAVRPHDWHMLQPMWAEATSARPVAA